MPLLGPTLRLLYYPTKEAALATTQERIRALYAREVFWRQRAVQQENTSWEAREEATELG